MKKHFLFLASLVLGFGQLFADQVTFSIADLRATLPSNNTKVEVPYTWKVSPYHVSVTIAKKDGTTGTLSIANPTTLTNYTLTVTVAGAGTLDGITVTAPTGLNALEASTGTYTSGTWTPEGTTSTVTFTPTSNFRLTQIAVDYTPDSGYTPDVPATASPNDAVKIDNLATYEGTDPFVFNKADSKIYVRNNLGQYEQWGLYTKVNTLAVFSNDKLDAETEYIRTSPSMASYPYLNTNYIPKNNTRVVATVNFASRGQYGWSAAFGCGYDSGGWKDRFCFFSRANNGRCAVDLGSETHGSPVYNRKTIVDINAATGITVIYAEDGTTELSRINDVAKAEENTCKTPLYIFAQNKDVPDGDTKTDCYNHSMTLYGLKIYEGETLVKDYVPYVTAEGKGGLKDKLSGDIITSANGADFEKGYITAYEGKIVRLESNSHEYMYSDGTWVDKGEIMLEEVSGDYQDIRNWRTNDGHMSIFANWTYDEGTGIYRLDPYVGTGGHEPLMIKVNTEEGADYNYSFTYSNGAYDSWHSTEIHAYVWNIYDLGTTESGFSENNNVLATYNFPFAGADNVNVSMDFTAVQNTETLVYQFGDGNDGKNFWFEFSKIKVSKYIYPETYPDIDPYAFIDFVATRTDANGVGYMVVAGGSGYNDNENWPKILDNDATTKFCGNLDQAWFIFKAENPVALKQYSLVTGADTYNYPERNPYNWIMQGSNDSKEWTDIDVKNRNYDMFAANSQEFVFVVNDETPYKYFRFKATACNAGVQISEIWINEQSHSYGEPEVTAATCLNPGKNVYTCSDCKAKITEVTNITGNHAAYDEEGKCTVCGKTPSELVLLNDGKEKDYTAKYKYGVRGEGNVWPDGEEGWNTAEFDDSTWDTMLMPIGGGDGGWYDNGPRKGARYNTTWWGSYNCYWFRRTFTLDDVSDAIELVFKARHDDNYWVYINGKQIEQQNDWNSDQWREINVDASVLKKGKNVLAIYIQQNWGGAYLDCSLTATIKDNVIVGDALYATYVAPFDVDFTGVEGITAKAATFDGTYVQLADVTTVPAGTAVVVKADAAGTFKVKKTANAVLGATNELQASTGDGVVADGTQYILAKEEQGVGFYKATGTITAGKGYLVISGDAAVKGFYGFDADDATGINEVNGQWSMINGQPIYNLAGQRIQKIQKGINIVGGKKVMVK